MKEYLGDSVYADFDGHMICLTTENGMGPSNTIYLEPEVILALIRYAESLKASEPAEPGKCRECGGTLGHYAGCASRSPGVETDHEGGGP